MNKIIFFIAFISFNAFCFKSLSKKERSEFEKQYKAYLEEYKKGNKEIVGKYCSETLNDFNVILIDPDSKKLRDKYIDLQSMCEECLNVKDNDSSYNKPELVLNADTNEVKLEFARMTTGMDIDSVSAFAARYPGWFEEDVIAIKRIATNRIISGLCEKEDWDEFTYWKDKVSFPKIVYDTYKIYLVKNFTLKKMVLFVEAFRKDPLSISEISKRYEQYLYDKYLTGDSESAKEYISRYPNGRFAADIKASLWQNKY